MILPQNYKTPLQKVKFAAYFKIIHTDTKYRD